MVVEDDYVFTFGKYKDEKLSFILSRDPKYLLWCVTNIHWFEVSDVMQSYLEELAAEEYRDMSNCLGDEFWKED